LFVVTLLRLRCLRLRLRLPVAGCCTFIAPLISRVDLLPLPVVLRWFTFIYTLLLRLRLHTRFTLRCLLRLLYVCVVVALRRCVVVTHTFTVVVRCPFTLPFGAFGCVVTLLVAFLRLRLPVTLHTRTRLFYHVPGYVRLLDCPFGYGYVVVTFYTFGCYFTVTYGCVTHTRWLRFTVTVVTLRLLRLGYYVYVVGCRLLPYLRYVVTLFTFTLLRLVAVTLPVVGYAVTLDGCDLVVTRCCICLPHTHYVVYGYVVRCWIPVVARLIVYCPLYVVVDVVVCVVHCYGYGFILPLRYVGYVAFTHVGLICVCPRLRCCGCPLLVTVVICCVVTVTLLFGYVAVPVARYVYVC